VDGAPGAPAVAVPGVAEQVAGELHAVRRGGKGGAVGTDGPDGASGGPWDSTTPAGRGPAGGNADSEGIREEMAGGHGIARGEKCRKRGKIFAPEPPTKHAFFRCRQKHAKSLGFFHIPGVIPHSMGWQ